MTWDRSWSYNAPFGGVTYINTVYAIVSTVATGSNWSTERVFIRVKNNVPVAVNHTSNLTFGGVVRAQQVDLATGSGATTTIYDFQHTTYRDSSGNATVNFNFRTNTSYGLSVSTGTLNITLDNIPQGTTITSYTITNQTFTSAQINWATAHQVNRVEFRLGGVSQPWQLGTSHTGSSGSFTITGLSPDWYSTTYIRARKVGSSEWTYSTGKPLETLKIAKFTSVPDNIDFSKPFTVEFNRNDATVVDIGIYNTSGAGTFAIYRTVTGTSYTFDLTEEEKNRFYDDMPTVYSKQYLVFIATNGNAYNQAVNRVFRIPVTPPSTPVFTHEDINATTLALTGSNQVYIQNYSDFKIDLETATTLRGATISKYTVINGSKTKDYTSSGVKTDFGKITANQLQVIITDSRGFTSQSIIALDYIPYSNPTIQNFSLNREIGTSTKADLITNGLYTNVNFGAVANKVKKVEYRKKSTGDYGSWIDITGKVVYGAGLFNNGTNQQINDFVFGTEFTVEIKISDELSFNTRTTMVSKGMFTMLIDQEYGSIGIGKIPRKEENSLDIAGNIYAPNLKPSFTKLRLSGQFNINVSGNITNWTINSQYNSDLTTNGTNITLSKGIYKISGSLFYRHLAGAGALQASVYLVHNSTDITRIGISTTAVNSLVPVPFPGQLIEVSENDTIKVRYEGFGTSGYLSASIDTYLNIEKIGD